MTTQKTLLESLNDAQNAIQKAQEAHNAYKGKESFPQFEQTLGALEESVQNYIKLCSLAMSEGKLKADPAGIMNGDSVFGDDVDAIAKTFIADNAEEFIAAAAIQNANASSFMGKIVLYTKAGAQFIYDGAKKVLTVIWNGIKATFKFIGQKASDFWNWIKSKFTKNDVKLAEA